MEPLTQILNEIKTRVLAHEPSSTLILFGSYARGDYHNESDIDILILIDKEHVSRRDEKRVVYSLYDIELEAGIAINPVIFSKHTWQSKYKITPFFANVTREGRLL